LIARLLLSFALRVVCGCALLAVIAATTARFWVRAGELAFESRTSGGDTTWDIYAIDIWRWLVVPLWEVNTEFNENLPAWSPDGERLAFVSTRDGDFEIYVLNSDGTVDQLTHNSFIDYAPAWSPDGSQITFQNYESGDWEIYVMNADGSQIRPLTVNGGTTATWSPDGSQIVYSTYGGEIYAINGDDPNAHQLGEMTSAYSLVWSPDGSQIAFLTLGQHLMLMGADGIVHDLTESTGYSVYALTWSPDGTLLAFVCDFHLCLADVVDNSIYRVLHESLMVAGGISWRP
jgi:Tol biopolymer transport system component